ncbi:MAG: AAA family ATPase [Rhodobacteraceae bacterium]|nr:AAA family ATPase [Paracoccaceae bacterium]
MTGIALESLSLTAFRGSSTTFKFLFEKGRKLTLVYGENGTGKTTICDALEFLAVGDVGSLNDKGMGQALEKYWPSVNKDLSDINVVLATSNGVECKGRFVDNKPVFEPADARPLIELLRQQQITALIETQPAKRYEVLQRFIDVEAVEKSEDTLQKLVQGLEADKKSKKAAEDQSLKALNDLFQAAGKPASLTAITWAKALLDEPQKNVEAELKAVELLRSILSKFGAYPDLLMEHQKSVVAAKDAFRAADTAMKAAVVTASGNASETVKLLEAGKSYLHAHADAAVCPLCESDDKIAGLAESINARLGQLASVQEAKIGFEKCQSNLNKVEDLRTQLDADYAKSLQNYATAKASFIWEKKYTFPASNPPSNIADIQQWLVAAEEPAKAWADAEASLRQGSNLLASVKRELDLYETSCAQKKEVEALISGANQALRICVKVRKDFTDKMMAEIAQQVGELYEKVHPNEGLEKIAFLLDPKKRSSIEMQAKFAGRNVPPPAYFSQSHLDTLGLCVFLALALRDKVDQKILILDDVLGSIDEPHVERVIDMLYAVSNRFRHTLITTHYRPWREKFRWGRLKPDQLCQFVELIGCGLDEGMRMKSALPEIARLKKLMEAEDPDLQAICSKAGVMLEEALDYLTQKYECAVPRRHGAVYTLGDLLSSVNSKLRDNLCVEIVIRAEGAEPIIQNIDLKPMLDELFSIANTRNVMGAHFNTLSFELLDADAMKFAKQVEQLVSALVCPEYGWPRSDKSGKYWENGGDTRRLHPLKKPS